MFISKLDPIRQTAFLNLAYTMIYADGRLDAAEKKLFYSYMGEVDVDLSKAQIVDFKEELAIFNDCNVEEKLGVFFELYALALADKIYAKEEKELVEIAKEWQNVDSPVRRVEASILIANKDKLYMVMGDGNVVEPTEDFISIGSGSVFALGAAKALIENTDLDARTIVEKSLLIASQYCIYTNDHLNIEEVE